MNPKLLPCRCKANPKFVKYKFDKHSTVDFVKVVCPNCGEQTFGAKLKGIVAELWNAARKLST